MFNVHYAGRKQYPFGRRRPAVPPTEGFGDLGLGQPSTLWVGQDQTSPIVETRYGFGWNTVINAPGTLTFDNSSWGFGTDTNLLVLGGTGAAVKVGYECPGMASGSTSIQFDFTWSCPVYWPAAFGGVPQIMFSQSNSQAAAANSRLAPLTLASATQASVTGSIAGSTQIPPTSAVAGVGFDTTVTRRGLFACTSQVRGGNRVWQSRLRTAAGEYTITSGAIVSVATGVAFNTLTMGYREFPTSYISSNLGFGGACCWKGIGASDAELTAILDTWANLYPLS